MKKIVSLLLIIIVAFACENSNESDGFSSINGMVADEKMSLMGDKETLDDNVIVSEKSTIQRKLIKKGSASFETKDLSTTRKNIVDLVKQNNGYIANDGEYKSHNRISNNLSIRVPAKNFDTLLAEISKGVEKFDNRNISISDVTEQFLDVQTRLKNKKALEARYLEILKKAKSVKEILEVEKEIGKLREDIEAAEGRLKYLQNQVSFSTLNITFYKTIAESESTFGSKFTNAFKDGFESIKAFFLFIIKIWPFIIILLGVFFYLRRRITRTKS